MTQFLNPNVHGNTPLNPSQAATDTLAVSMNKKRQKTVLPSASEHSLLNTSHTQDAFNRYCVKSPTSDRIALFDVDGVLLDLWTPMHTAYEEYNHITVSNDQWVEILRDFDRNPAPYIEFGKHFMTSETFANLKPLPYTQELPNNLKSTGWDLVIITAANPDLQVYKNRCRNLLTYYGDIFKTIHCTGSKDKTSLIKEYAALYPQVIFCDDHPATVGQSCEIVTKAIWKQNNVLGYRKNELDPKKTYWVENAAQIWDIAHHQCVKKTRLHIPPTHQNEHT